MRSLFLSHVIRIAYRVMLIYIGEVWTAEGKAASSFRGVVVESPAKNSNGQLGNEMPGQLRPGDVLTTLVCGGKSSPIHSPFQLARDSGEQTHCGSVIRVWGNRGTTRRSWSVEESEWKELKVRPRFEGNLLLKYEDAERLARVLEIEKATVVFDQMAEHSAEPWLGVWLHLHAAQLAAQHGVGAKTDVEFQLALDNASRVRPGLVAAVYLQKADLEFLSEQWAKAVQDYQRALEQGEKGKVGRLAIAYYLEGTGSSYLQAGDLTAAEKYLSRSLTEVATIAPKGTLATIVMNNLGSVAWRRGDLLKAEEYFLRDQRITAREHPNSLLLANSLENFGALCLQRGDLPQARKYFARALRMTQRVEPNNVLVAFCLHNLAALIRAQGDLDGSERMFLEALKIKTTLVPNSLSVANTESKLSRVLLDKGNLIEASRYAHSEMEIFQRLAPNSLQVAVAFSDSAAVLTAARNEEGAKEQLLKALEIRQHLAPGSTAHAETLAALAGIEKNANNLESSAHFYEQAVAALEMQTDRLGGGDKLMAEFRARHAQIYDGYIEVLLKKKEPGLALEVLERSRAQSLREMLVSGRIDIHQGVDPYLLGKERSLREQIAAKLDQRLRALTAKHTEAETLTLTKELEDLSSQSEQVEANIRRRNPSYAALMKPVRLTTAAMQTGLLDSESVLLEYSLGEEQSHIWVVSPNLIQVIDLPGRSVIEKLARDLYNLVRARGQWLSGENGYQKRTRVAQAQEELPGKSVELSKVLLGPVANYIRGKRLVIVGDGALLYVPFAMLPDPEGFSRHSSTVPLIVGHEIIMLPSASVLSVLREHPKNNKPPSKTVAVLADPVFERQDDRVEPKVLFSSRPPRTENFTRSMSDVGLASGGVLHLPRLGFTRDEAQKILAATPAGQGLAALDFEASRALATSPELADFRIVHFATHGVLDTVHPELSGLVLSMVNKSGKSQNGFLGLEDIFNLNLSADLIVLSACETALGAEIRSEGTIGLTRAFMYAGAPRVVASLWKVDDAATAELMSRFYVLMERKRMRPAEALRAAQIAMAAQERWQSPFFWAAFRIEGEWK